jgi:hypothetical protein
MGRCGNTYNAGTCTDGYDGDSDELREDSATVDSFHLDTFEVTLGRFRKLGQAYDGTPPTAGAGDHRGLGAGWKSAWNTHLTHSQAVRIGNLKCSATLSGSDIRRIELEAALGTQMAVQALPGGGGNE